MKEFDDDDVVEACGTPMHVVDYLKLDEKSKHAVRRTISLMVKHRTRPLLFRILLSPVLFFRLVGLFLRAGYSKIPSVMQSYVFVRDATF